MKHYTAVVALALSSALLGGCGGMASPTAPSSIAAASVTPSITVGPPLNIPVTPAPVGSPFTISIAGTGSTAFHTDAAWTSTLTLLPAIDRVILITVDCGNGRRTQTSLSSIVWTWDLACLFPTVGTYTVNVTAVSEGQQASASRTVSVTPGTSTPVATPIVPQPPQGAFDLSVRDYSRTYVSNTWLLTAQSPGGAIWHWEFGDGSTADGPTGQLTHEYFAEGTVTATVTGTMPDGSTRTTARTFTVIFETVFDEDPGT